MNPRTLLPGALYSDARAGLTAGILRLKRQLLRSAWSDAGYGWQELWDEAPYAGFYASCDGLLILSAARAADISSGVDVELFEKVFDEHLLRVLNTSEPALGAANQQMRAECSTIVMKLAKFIQVANVHPHLSQTASQVLARVASTLAKSSCGPGAWPAVIATDRSIAGDCAPNLCATVESLRCLRGCLADVDISAAAKYLDAALQHGASHGPAAGGDGAIAVWAAAELGPVLPLRLRKSAASLLRTYLQYYSDVAQPDAWVRSVFSNPVTRRNDYYTYNAPLILASAALTFFGEGLTGASDLPIALSIADQAAEQLRDSGTFLTPHAPTTHFWQFSQAMELLSKFTAVYALNEPAFREPIMHVNPVVFQKKSFIANPNLAVVLMPFRPSWAADVFDTFRRAVHGAGFEVWRSDLTYKDDTIIQTIWEQVCASRFVIADCSGRNPNVFYELGIAHTIGKPVFLCAQKRADFPFDIAAVRSHEYQALPGSLKKLRKVIRSFILELPPA